MPATVVPRSAGVSAIVRSPSRATWSSDPASRRGPAVECVEAHEQPERGERQAGLGEHCRLGAGGGRDHSRQQRARRRARGSGSWPRARWPVGGSSGRTSAGIRLVKPPNDSGQVIPATSATAIRTAAGTLPMPNARNAIARGGHHLVDGHQQLAAAAEVEPGAQQRAGHEARERDRADEAAGQRRAARALEREQHDPDRVHLVGDPRRRGRGDEARVAGLAGEQRVGRGGHAPTISSRPQSMNA